MRGPRQAEVGIAVSTATTGQGAASVVLTEAGLTNIVALVGRAGQFTSVF